MDAAAEAMRHRVMTGGVRNGVMTGEPRILTGAMYSSIGAKMFINARGRAQGEYGYIHDAPYYTGYQEPGTSRIVPLNALVVAHELAAARLSAEVSNINIWGGLR